jgi:cytochrome oxidase Cu insertion factor (SCO1/SenC/PrrC family)
MPKPVPPTAEAPFGRLIVIGAAGVLLTIVVAIALLRRTGGGEGGGVLAAPADSAEAFTRVQPFELTERSGARVTLDTLKGRVWVAAFVFTRCTGPCPRISANMRKLQDRLQGTDVRLVSFSVDPTYDTPEVLARYAQDLGADPQRWLFLTGPLEEMRKVSFQSFLLPFERDAAQPVGQMVTHRTVLTVVDKDGVIRGYYDGEGDAGVEQAFQRAKFLASAP